MTEVPGMRKVRFHELVWKATRSEEEEIELSTRM